MQWRFGCAEQNAAPRFYRCRNRRGRYRELLSAADRHGALQRSRRDPLPRSGGQPFMAHAVGWRVQPGAFTSEHSPNGGVLEMAAVAGSPELAISTFVEMRPADFLAAAEAFCAVPCLLCSGSIGHYHGPRRQAPRLCGQPGINAPAWRHSASPIPGEARCDHPPRIEHTRGQAHEHRHHWRRRSGPDVREGRGGAVGAHRDLVRSVSERQDAAICQRSRTGTASPGWSMARGHRPGVAVRDGRPGAPGLP